MNDPCNKGLPPLKRPTTYDEQLDLLVERGLLTEEENFCLDILSKVNYYRFSAYLLPFKEPGKECFKKNTSFEQIYRIYEFDRKLRNQIMTAIEPIEILLRTKIAYHHGHRYGTEGYTNKENFDDPGRHDKFIKEFQKTVQKNSKALFVKHHLEKYNGRFPIWVATEMFSFGMLSKFYANMKSDDRKYIARNFFHVGPQHLQSWLVCLTDLRNRCAHYMRLYYHKLVFYPKLPTGPYEKCSRRVFDVLYVTKYLYPNHSEWANSFLPSLEALIIQYSDDIIMQYIGFPENWLALLKKKPE